MHANGFFETWYILINELLKDWACNRVPYDLIITENDSVYFTFMQIPLWMWDYTYFYKCQYAIYCILILLYDDYIGEDELRAILLQ